MKIIPISSRFLFMFALVDDEDYERISAFKWSLRTDGYAVTSKQVLGKRTFATMHRVVLNEKRSGIVVHHRNEWRLDNRKSNLERLSPSEHGHHHGVEHAAEVKARFKIFPEQKPCTMCGDLFTPKHRQWTRSKYCSRCRGGVHAEPQGVAA